MDQVHRLFDNRRLLVWLSLLMVAGFVVTSLSSYFVSRHVIREVIIGQELPLAASKIYAEIQKDLVRPVLVSSTMAHDTFLRDWVLRGERDASEIARYLEEVKKRHGAFSSFFVSERTSVYYTGDGVLKRVSPNEPRDIWYYRVRDMKDLYEINVDPDMANKDAMTIFINYRAFDFDGRYIGATGIGLTIDALHRLINDYQQRYWRTIYFVNPRGETVLFGGGSGQPTVAPREREGLRDILPDILRQKNGGYQYHAGGDSYLLNVHYIPELKWYLFVEKDETEALAEVRKTLYFNLAVAVLVTLLVVVLAHLALKHYQRRLEKMASTDELTGLLNRHAFTILLDKLLADYERESTPVSALMCDIDHFKRINDQFGHAMGDQVLARVADLLRAGLRRSDFAVRWGGEEFLLVLKKCDMAEARQIGEKLRQSIEHEVFTVGGQRVPITVSVGISTHEKDRPFERTVSCADEALYMAKREGRNRVETAPESAAS